MHHAHVTGSNRCIFSLFFHFLPNELNVYCCVHFGPGVPVILIEGVFDRHDGILRYEFLVYTKQLVRRQLPSKEYIAKIFDNHLRTIRSPKFLVPSIKLL